MADPSDPYAYRAEYSHYPLSDTEVDDCQSPLYYEGARPISDDELSDEDESDRRCCPAVSILKIIAMLAMTFCAGALSGQFMSGHPRRESDVNRDSLMMNQERLLLDLAKTKRLPRENKEIMDHVELLQNELEQKASALHIEVQLRTAAEKEVTDAWQSFQMNQAQSAGTAKQYEEDMSRLSRTLIRRYYGPGPHYAQFTLIIPVEAGPREFFFTVEMASEDFMPAAALTFMEQVDAGVWDGTSFHINSPLALFAQPVSVRGDYSNLPRMEKMGLARLPFAEFNDDFPHEAYSLGFSGSRRPGPNFYINKQDNVVNHFGEPCFAKVIIGHDVIDWVSRLEGPPDDPFFIDPIEIKSIRVLNELREAVGSDSYIRAMHAADRSRENL